MSFVHDLGNFEKGEATTQKTPFMKPCIILDFHSEYYRSEIENLVFNLPCV